MTHAFRGLGLAASLVLASTLAVAPQASAQSTSSTSSTAAHVYVQTDGPEGSVYGFNASSTGQLSAISGSPFKPGTAIVGATSTKFFTLGQTLLHSYGIASDGAIESQIAEIPIYDYAGKDCGDASDKSYTNINSAVLDHSGEYIYVLLQGGPGNCGAYQTYKISKGGDFTFVGEIEQDGINVEPVPGGVTLPSILGNETFAYAEEWSGYVSNLIGFRRESTGALQWLQFTETDPPLNDNYWTPQSPDASPAGDYVVVQLLPGDTGPAQLGTYTVDSKGNISSTNTTSNMPTSEGNYTSFSPSGKLVADWGGSEQGVTIYHFNGAAPLTLYKTLLSGTLINQVAWDSSNHLYAASDDKLYVFTVTPTSVTEESSRSIGSPFKIIVVSE
jgi:hypothetical protein